MKVSLVLALLTTAVAVTNTMWLAPMARENRRNCLMQRKPIRYPYHWKVAVF